MTLSQQWVEIERGLPTAWADARLALSVPDAAQAIRATALLASLQPGRSGDTIRFTTARRGAGFGPEHVRKLLRKLDAEKIRGRLTLVSTGEPATEPELSRATFLGEWEAALAVLPTDWSDLYAEIELVSTDWLHPRPRRRDRARLDGLAGAARAPHGPRQPCPLRWDARLRLPRREPLRLRRLD